MQEYNYIKGILEKAISLTENPMTESLAYKVFVKLEQTFFENGGNEIYYLEKILEENSGDLESTLELARILDKRNNDGDLKRCFNLLKGMVHISNSLAKEEIINSMNKNYFHNLQNSSLADDLHKLLKLDN